MRDRRNRLTRNLAVSAVLCALGAVVMSLGAVIEVLDLTVSAFGSLLMIFAFIELGSPYTWLIWLVTSAVSALVFPASTVWLLYFVLFGIFPILKGYIERMGRPVWIFLKLLSANALTALGVLAVIFIFKLPIVDLEALPFEISPYVLYPVLILALNLCILLYDRFLTVMARFYLARLRARIAKILK